MPNPNPQFADPADAEGIRFIEAERLAEKQRITEEVKRHAKEKTDDKGRRLAQRSKPAGTRSSHRRFGGRLVT